VLGDRSRHGIPFEYGLQTTLIATRLAERLGVDQDTAIEVYYASLLAHAGCTTDVHVAAEIFGSSLTEQFHPVKYGTPARRSWGCCVRCLTLTSAGWSARPRSPGGCLAW
jgi:hypothetical protein